MHVLACTCASVKVCGFTQYCMFVGVCFLWLQASHNYRPISECTCVSVVKLCVHVRTYMSTCLYHRETHFDDHSTEGSK